MISIVQIARERRFGVSFPTFSTSCFAQVPESRPIDIPFDSLNMITRLNYGGRNDVNIANFVLGHLVIRNTVKLRHTYYLME